jgi:hypothetical protein
MSLESVTGTTVKRVRSPHRATHSWSSRGLRTPCTVRAQAGDDVIDAGLLAPGTVERLLEFGGSDDEPDDDTLMGHPGNNELHGGGGNDRLEARGGDDLLDGGPGQDSVIP